MTQEKDADAFKITCTKCEHEWTVSRAEWITLNRVTGGIPHCQKCGCGKILWKPIKYSQRRVRVFVRIGLLLEQQGFF